MFLSRALSHFTWPASRTKCARMNRGQLKATGKKMRRVIHAVGAVGMASMVVLGISVRVSHAIQIDWVWVEDSGNASDPATGNQYGAVTDAFRIMKFEWTNAQYVAFLNAIDPEGSNPGSVYHPNMSGNARGGIVLDVGAVAGSKYSIKTNMGNKPVNYVSWFDAARVANWLHHGAKTYDTTNATADAPQNTGAYSLGTATSGIAPAKNQDARYWIPSENEWYKAAFYNPTLNSHMGGYTLYGNGSDAPPTAVTADATGEGNAGSSGSFANYANGGGWNNQTGNVTTVGTNGAASYYGAFDMSGNVWEWTDFDGISNASRGLRGGSWTTAFVSNLSSSGHGLESSSYTSNSLGFRLVRPVPEPTTLGLASGGAVCTCTWWVLRRRKRARPQSLGIASGIPLNEG
jgi:sulfatase modifying factor 1